MIFIVVQYSTVLNLNCLSSSESLAKQSALLHISFSLISGIMGGRGDVIHLRHSQISELNNTCMSWSSKVK